MDAVPPILSYILVILGFIYVTYILINDLIADIRIEKKRKRTYNSKHNHKQSKQ